MRATARRCWWTGIRCRGLAGRAGARPGGGGAGGPAGGGGAAPGGGGAAALTRRLRRAFEALGWRVALNQPYSGGWTTQRWGRPAEGFHAVQVELNRALYFDEAERTPGRGWPRCAAGVGRVIGALLSDPSPLVRT